MPENLLSQEMVEQIVKETHLERKLSQSEIRKLASALNGTLSQHEHRKKLCSEPTPPKLRKQISDLHKALRKLKLAFPDPKTNSLRNYLIHLGEDYATARGAHRNLEPRYVGGLLPTGDTWEMIFHYRSDERLDEMINCVSQVLQWMDKAKKSTQERLHWWDLPPLDEQTVEERFESGDGWPIERHKLKESLIGFELPSIYQSTFGRRYGVSKTASGKYGPGVRFVMSVLKHAGMNIKPDTVIRYRTRAKSKKH